MTVILKFFLDLFLIDYRLIRAALILTWWGRLSFWEGSNTHFDMTATHILIWPMPDILIWLYRLVLLCSFGSHFEIKDFSPSCLRSKRQSFSCHKSTVFFCEKKSISKRKNARKKTIKTFSYQKAPHLYRKNSLIIYNTKIPLYNRFQAIICIFELKCPILWRIFKW